MDPISIVVAALIAGLTAGLTETAKSSIKDLYDELKSRLNAKVASSPDAKDALMLVEKQPTSTARQEVLKEELALVGIDKDSKLLELGQKVLETLDPKGTQVGKYIVNIEKGQGIAIGPNAQVTQNFSKKK